MLVAASVSAQSLVKPLVSDLHRDQRAGRASQTHPSADGLAQKPDDPSAAASKVQPASQTEKSQDATSGKKAGGEPLSDEEERQVQDLKETDAKVRAHEQAHATAGGPYASAPSYELTTGPDGKRYAMAGEVEIDTAPVRGDPEATIRKMDAVIRAALAPAEPSSQDLAVARTAQQQRSEAQAELFKQRDTERSVRSEEEAGEPGSTNAEEGGTLLSELLAQADAAYGRRADKEASALANEIFSAARERSIVV